MRRNLAGFGGLILLLTALLPSVQAQETEETPGVYANVGFTVIIEDDSDYPIGFLDIREVALGEPGNDTLVFRIKPEDPEDSLQDSESIDVFYTAGGDDHRSGIRADGTAKATSSQTPPFDFCFFEGEFGYCSVTYEAVDVVVGDQITEPFAISYENVAQDYAPGDLFVPDGIMGGGVGADYTLVGDTTTGGAEKFSLSASETESTAEPGGAALFNLTVTNEANSTANFTLNATGLPEGFNATFDPPSGTVTAGNSTSSNLTVRVPRDAEEGEHPFQVNVQGSAGGNARLNLTVTVGGEPSPSPTSPPGNRTRPTRTNMTGNATGNETAGVRETEDGGFIPGIELAAILVAAAIALVGTRRSRK